MYPVKNKQQIAAKLIDMFGDTELKVNFYFPSLFPVKHVLLRCSRHQWPQLPMRGVLAVVVLERSFSDPWLCWATCDRSRESRPVYLGLPLTHTTIGISTEEKVDAEQTKLITTPTTMSTTTTTKTTTKTPTTTPLSPNLASYYWRLCRPTSCQPGWGVSFRDTISFQ